MAASPIVSCRAFAPRDKIFPLTLGKHAWYTYLVRQRGKDAAHDAHRLHRHHNRQRDRGVLYRRIHRLRLRTRCRAGRNQERGRGRTRACCPACRAAHGGGWLRGQASTTLRCVHSWREPPPLVPRSIETHHILCVSRVGSPYRGGTTNGDATRATPHERRTDGDLRYSLQEGKRKLSTERRSLGYWSQYIWGFCGKFPYRRHNMWWFYEKLPYIWWFCGDFAYRDFSHGSPPGPRPTEK